jgi:serine/threonine-protein kinase
LREDPVTAASGVTRGALAGRYTIERELGRGLTAIVYLAKDTQEGRAVAVKVLRPEYLESVARDRFLREIRDTQKLKHPNIVSVLDAGDRDGQLFFVLPYMERGTLRRIMKRDSQLPLPSMQSSA